MADLDAARFRLDALRADLDARIRLAAARADLAERSVDIAKKRVELAAEIAEQRRMAAAYQDFTYARRAALATLRKLKRHQHTEEERLKDLKGLLVADSATAVRSGWIGLSYFLRRITFASIRKIREIKIGDSPCLDVFGDLRRANARPLGVAAECLLQVVELMAADVQSQAERTRVALLDVQKRADAIRTADWKTVNLDTSWVK